MPNDAHNQAQELSIAAELALRAGDRPEAYRLYAEAAELEREAFTQLPADKPRSRGILAVSYAALLFKAKEYERAEAEIYRILAGDLDPAFRAPLKELLQVSWEEQELLKVQLQYSDDEILVALRGGEIGMGTARADVAVRYMNAVHSLAYRAAECDAGLTLRSKGPPSPAIQSFLQARATQPAVGSYRFSIRFVEPAQTHLFPEQVALPDSKRVSTVVVQVLRTITGADPAALERLVPRPEYRLALARLARNLVPGGAALTEVEVRQAHDSPDEAVRLHVDQKRRINETIRTLLPASDHLEATERSLQGVLRALDLDRNWLEIRTGEGKNIRVQTGANELDDVIGPLVNRKVLARVTCSQLSSSQKTTFRLVDIESLED